MGHPDKVADQISDAILDAMLAVDPHSRVACETMVTTGLVVVAGEVTCTGYVDIPQSSAIPSSRSATTMRQWASTAESCAVLVASSAEPRHRQGVDREGAGDQGMMFGFACRETPQLMPLPIQLAHRLVEQQAEVRREQHHRGPAPRRQEPGHRRVRRPQAPAVDTVVLSTQHDPMWNNKQAELKKQVIEHIIKPVLGEWWHEDDHRPRQPDRAVRDRRAPRRRGLTGRKIIVDTYGGRGRHGGGAFSGKDPTKVDRSAAYMARYIAKNVVAADLADECEVQLSYAIGVAEPTSVTSTASAPRRSTNSKI
jgi:S-adenosylmethionine synthetase